MSDRFVIVHQAIPPTIKPEYDNLEEAAAALLHMKETSPQPGALTLLKFTESEGVIVRTELTVSVQESPDRTTPGVPISLPGRMP